jgi:hypothetical protein
VVGELDTEQGDIAPKIQVRSTRYDTGHLLLHESDIPDHVFVLVCGLAPKFRLAGWTTPKVSRKPDFWKVYKGRGAYWVPQDALSPVRKSFVRNAS